MRSQLPGHPVVIICVVGVDPERGLILAEGSLVVVLGKQGVAQAEVSLGEVELAGQGVMGENLDRDLEFADGTLRVVHVVQAACQVVVSGGKVGVEIDRGLEFALAPSRSFLACRQRARTRWNSE